MNYRVRFLLFLVIAAAQFLYLFYLFPVPVPGSADLIRWAILLVPVVCFVLDFFLMIAHSGASVLGNFILMLVGIGAHIAKFFPAVPMVLALVGCFVVVIVAYSSIASYKGYVFD